MSLFKEVLIDSHGQSLFVSSDHGLSKYDISTGNLVKHIDIPTVCVNDPEGFKAKTKTTQAVITHLRFLKESPDGSLLASILDDPKALVIFNSADLSIYGTYVFPKRPCSIDFIDPTRLIIGDKFGDVYEINVDPQSSDSGSVVEITGKPLLGHVSMLVDVAFAQHNDYKAVVSADRDEHIRVTRYPHTFIIDRWLFGHTQFVSTVELVPWQTNLLVSGGGDHQIILWDWTTGEKLSVLSLDKDTLKDNSFPDTDLVVNKLLILPQTKQILVSFEQTPFLVLLSIDVGNSGAVALKHVSTFKLSIQLEVLDVDVHQSEERQLVAVAYKDPTVFFKLYKLESTTLDGSFFLSSEQTIRAAQDHSTAIASDPKSLYPLESLRKRPGHYN